MKLKFFAVILPVFIFVIYLISQGAFAQNEAQKINVYEGLGLKMKYFDPWEIKSKDDDPSCVDLCITGLSTPDFKAMIMIVQEKFDKPEIKNKCKCDTLLEFVKYKYETISKNEDLVFINDNQTTLTDDNIPAIQMEFENKGTILIDKNSIEIFTKGPNSFYGISFSADKNEQYSNYLDDFKKMLTSLEFVSANEPKQKQPSFMMDTKESNNTSPNQNLTNESVLDLSNNGKQQLSESIITCYDENNPNSQLGKSLSDGHDKMRENYKLYGDDALDLLDDLPESLVDMIKRNIETEILIDNLDVTKNIEYKNCSHFESVKLELINVLKQGEQEWDNYWKNTDTEVSKKDLQQIKKYIQSYIK